MDSQCKLLINHGKQRLDSLKMYSKDCLMDIPERDFIEVRENTPFSLQLLSNNQNDYFKLLELNDYDIAGRVPDPKNSDQDVYISKKEYHIYAPEWLTKVSIFEKQTVELSPGNYTVEIHSNDHIYYAYWKIIPKDINNHELINMRNEVETMIKGLAMDFVSKKRGTASSLREGIESPYYYDDIVDFIIRDKKSIIFCLENILNEAKYKINKKYSWNMKGQKNIVDQLSFRKMSERSNKEQMYSFKRYLDYDVNENRWLKSFIVKLINLCDSKLLVINDVKNKKNEYYKEQLYYSHKHNDSRINYLKNNLYSINLRLDNMSNELHILSNYLKLYRNNEFIRDIPTSKKPIISKTIMLKPAYNSLYKISRILFHNKKLYLLDSYYGKYWKRTAELYEIWTYVKVLQALINVGFTPIDGWIYDHSADNLLPFLNDGTQVHLIGLDNLMINLTYNERLPHNKKEVNNKIPLMTSSNRDKPDIRIDVFIKKNNYDYLSSIILDAKYKKLGGIINDEHHTRVQEQFNSYLQYPTSNLTKFTEELKGKVRVVDSMMVLYPNNDVDSSKEEIDNKNDIFYCQLKPNVGQTTFEKELLNHIEKIKKLQVHLIDD